MKEVRRVAKITKTRKNFFPLEKKEKRLLFYHLMKEGLEEFSGNLRIAGRGQAEGKKRKGNRCPGTDCRGLQKMGKGGILCISFSEGERTNLCYKFLGEIKVTTIFQQRKKKKDAPSKAQAG